MQPDNPWVLMGQKQASAFAPRVAGPGATFADADVWGLPPQSMPGAGYTPPRGPAPQFVPPAPAAQDFGAQWEKFYGAPPRERLAALEHPPPPEAGTPAAAQASIEAQAAGANAADAAAVAAAVAAGGAPAGGAPRGTQVSEGVKTTAKSSGPGTSLRDLIGQLNARELDALKQQGLTAEKLRTALGQLEKKDLPTDLTGLAVLTDAWTGSNFAQHYRPEETARDRQSAVEKLRGQITSAEQGLSEQEVGLLRSKLNSQFQLENLEASEKQRAEQNRIEWAKLAAEKKKVAQTNPMDAFQAQVTLDKLDTTKVVRGSIELVDALNTYEGILNKYGGKIAGVPKAELDNAYSAITLAYKNAGELGALSGPDMNIVRQGVDNPGGLTGWFRTGISGGDAGVREQIRAMRSAAAHKFDQRYQGLQEVSAPIYPLVKGYVEGFRGRMDDAIKSSRVATMGRDELIAQARAKAAKEAQAAGGQP